MAVGCAAALAAFSAPSAHAAACPNADVQITPATIAVARAAMLCLLNAVRTEHGLPPLRYSSQLAPVAQEHATDMATRHYFSHKTLGGAGVIRRLLATGYAHPGIRYELGEAMSYDYGDAVRPSAMMARLANSPAHRVKLLARRFRDIGIGIAPGAPFPVRGSSGATYVFDLGLRGAFGPSPRPVLGRSFTVRVISGVVFVRRPGSASAQQIFGAELLPMGSTVDARLGRIRLTSVKDHRGTLQSSAFYGGSFTVTQTLGTFPVTLLALVGGDFGACQTTPGPGLRMIVRRPPVRRVWGNASGRFRTRGRYGAATVRGTIWLTEDRCDGTLIVVTRGTVLVYDRVLRRTVVVGAGHSYFARAPR